MKRWIGLAALGMAVSVGAMAQDTTPAAPAAAAPAATTAVMDGGTIRGTVKAGPVPLPGVSVTATNTLTGKKYATTTDINGSFAMVIPRKGRYVVKVELTAFAATTQEVVLNAASENGGKPEQVTDFSMQLASRAEQQEAAQQQASARATANGIARGVQSLSVTGGATDLSDASAGGGNAGVQMPTLSGLGDSDTAASESVAVNGQMGQTNGLANFSEDEIRQRVQDAMAQAQRQGGAAGDVMNAVAGMLGGMMGPGGPGGFGGGGGGGGRGGGGRGGGGGGFRGFNPTQPHGAIFYQGGNGALNATSFSVPYALGEVAAKPIKPDSMLNKFGVTFAGSPYIPGLIKPSTKQFIFFNVTGQRNINPLIYNGTVPTLAERGGDFSALLQGANPQILYDPQTGQPIPGNNLKNASTPISAQALALLNYYPAPNVSNATLNNYQTVTNAGQNSTQASLRYVRNFGQNNNFGSGFGRRQAANAPATLRQNINFNGSYTHSASDQRNIFLPLGGTTESDGYGVTAGYTIGYGRFTNNASINWNRSHGMTQNYFTNGSLNPAVNAGVLVGNTTIQTTPFYYGVPSIQFGGGTAFTGLSNTAPADTINQTISFSDFVSWSHKKHNMRFGGDIRRVHADSFGGAQSSLLGSTPVTPLGSFSFTGYATENPAARACTPSATTQCPTLPASGSGFADFLLGMPQQAAVQAGLSKIYLRANVYDWYAQDDWRAMSNLTLNYGLRYEYFSPYVEKDNRLVNLAHNATFTDIAAVQPGQTSTLGGSYPRSLVNPDRSMFSPRFGFAYRPKPKIFKETVVRGGYGINYNTGQYATIAKYMANQPPFAITQTNIEGSQGCGTLGAFTLAGAFNCSTATVQNNFGANLNYRLGHVQIWDLDIQQTVPWGIVLNIGYDGAKGGNLDMVRAPNRTATGLLNPNVQAFAYEDSLGYSRFEALRVNARKRMQKGISLQATYQYGHSIDNASSIGGTAQTVAQNDLDLNAEEGNSSFDIRQKLTGDWVFELPFGPNRALLSRGGFWSKALDGFSVSGDFTFQTGNYFTPQYQLTQQEAATGTGTTLRPDRDFNVPIKGAQRIGQWFNPDAFTAPPLGAYGTASRNSIEGPGTEVVDLSLSRTVALGDTRSFEARVTASNALNLVSYSGIDTTKNSPTFGQVTSTGQMRTLTVLARYRF